MSRLNLVRRIFPSATDALRPRLACEVTPWGVLAARPGPVDVAGESQEMVTAFAPLRFGAVTPGLKAPNLPERAAVATALRAGLEEVGDRERKVTVVVPDAAVRVLLLDFDALPPKNTEVVPILRFRLRKLVTFEVDDAAIGYQLLPPRADEPGAVRAAVAVMPGAVRGEYESAVREAGFEPGAVLPSSMAALAAVPGDGAALVVNRNWNSITTAITDGNDILLYRTLDLPEPEPDTDPSLRPGIAEAHARAELQQAVSVALAYFEDTLARSPSSLFAVGPGGAAELKRLLGEEMVRVRDLVPGSGGGAVDRAQEGGRLPAGMMGGVVGALAS